MAYKKSPLSYCTSGGDNYVLISIYSSIYILYISEYKPPLLISSLCMPFSSIPFSVRTMSNKVSGETESFEDGLLEYPQYSRPEEWKGKKVPAIILSGDHGKVDAWRHEQSLLRTRDRRPDLLEKASLTQKDREFLEKHQ